MLSNEGIVAANGPELLWFSLDGRFRGRGGGRGSGPSEFREVVGLEVLPGDTVVGFGRTPPSAKYFGPDGSFVEAVRFPPLPLRIGRVISGEWVGLERARTAVPETTGEFTEDWYVVRLSASGESIDTVTRVGGERFWGSATGSVRVLGSPRAYVAARGDRIIAASSDAYVIRVFDAAGIPLQVVKSALPNPPYVAPAPRSRPLRGTESGSLQGLDPPIPEFAPAFDQLLLSNSGEVWVRREGRPDGQTWHVFDRAGVRSATVRLPAEFRLTEIGESWLLGIWTDAVETESLRLLQIVYASNTP